MQVRPGCTFVSEWNLPFRNPGSATDKLCSALVKFEVIKEDVLQSQEKLEIYEEIYMTPGDSENKTIPTTAKNKKVKLFKLYG